MVAYYRWRTTMMKERIALIAIAGVAIGYGLLTKASGQATTDSYVVVAGGLLNTENWTSTWIFDQTKHTIWACWYKQGGNTPVCSQATTLP
jgi:hypothetical protein